MRGNETTRECKLGNETLNFSTTKYIVLKKIKTKTKKLTKKP